ncbi:DUF1992 domain-containing protein [Aestuariimicrobium sp. p3-SID1156]|uniref:DnaJ family domain-containing protein n=1 Tax=Aestuariimicrobium sp. p3-SID1156 TaxID=2916038 RepID=UPI00223C39CE|nr:DUF1992 domain-containing protein [Aestuariimicrobium sp. p3-SID1156]MCT1458718.1 DUF1992 domain-containing protein [Aestuariimicrobium sp. p3-SID1156]
MSGPGFENWIDRQIREATERGEFDNLPGAGKPLNLGDPNDELWWVRRKLKDEDLSAALPTSLQLRKEKAAIQDALAGVRSAQLAKELIEDLNARIRDANVRQVEGVPIFTAPLDVEATLEEWRAGQPRGRS